MRVALDEMYREDGPGQFREPPYCQEREVEQAETAQDKEK
jgi:hypothetical protein